MTLYISATTNCPDLSIDFIDVRLKSGEVVSLNWDDTEYDNEEGKFDAL